MGGDRSTLKKAVCKFESPCTKLHFVYEAGPCGFRIERALSGRGHECWVVSPSLIPKRSGERIKTDEEYVDAVEVASSRIARLTGAIGQASVRWNDGFGHLHTTTLCSLQ